MKTRRIHAMEMTTMHIPEGVRRGSGLDGRVRQTARRCRSCRAPVEPLLDFGPQPVAARFPARPDEDALLHPLALVLCPSCGLAQLSLAAAPELLAPPTWAGYNEPEDHLDALCRTLADMESLARDRGVLGVTLKDDTTLARLAALGFSGVRRLETAGDLGIPPGRGFESVPDALTPERALELVQGRGAPGVVIARHVLEHAGDPRCLLEALRLLAGPGGLVVLEVPDCARAFERLEYAAIWEEHVSYFTERVFLESLFRHGLEVLAFSRHAYALEDSLVAVARAREQGPERTKALGAREETARLRAFAAAYPGHRLAWEAWLSGLEGPAALFGAGHHAVSFVNLLGLAHRFDFAVDANPNKAGSFLPGSRLPVLGPEALSEGGARTCLLCANPAAQEKILAANRSFLEGGGRFASIFPGSSLYPLPRP